MRKFNPFFNGFMNIHLYHSPLTHETRIYKITKSLVDLGIADSIEIIGKFDEGLKHRQNIDSNRALVRLATFFKGRFIVYKALGFIEWNIRSFIYCLFRDIKMVNAHSLTVLPLSYFICLIKRATLVYEPHELETESSGTRGLKKKFLFLLESLFIRKADLVYTVGEDISAFYQNSYRLEEVHTILNVPEFQSQSNLDSNILSEKLNIPDQDLIFIYQGLISEARGIKVLLASFADLPNKYHLVLLGFGPLEEMAKEYQSLHKNIHFLEAVPQEKILEYTSSADVGICYLVDDCLSYRLSLPNKLFEYMHSGLPVIINETQKSTKSLIEEKNCGFVVNNNAIDFASSIINISREEIQNKALNILELRERFSWHQQENEMKEIYNGIR